MCPIIVYVAFLYDAARSRQETWEIIRAVSASHDTVAAAPGYVQTRAICVLTAIREGDATWSFTWVWWCQRSGESELSQVGILFEKLYSIFSWFFGQGGIPVVYAVHYFCFLKKLFGSRWLPSVLQELQDSMDRRDQRLG